MQAYLHSSSYEFFSQKTFLSFNNFSFVTSLFTSLFTFSVVRSLEVLLNSSYLSPSLHLCPFSIFSSRDIDSTLPVSVSCNPSVAILTLLEAVLQHFCSSTLCLQQGRGSTFVSLFLQKRPWRHNVTFFSRSSFNISSFSLPPHSLVLDVLFTAVVTAVESSCSNVQLIRTVHSAVFRHMFLGGFVQTCSHVCSEPWHQLSSGQYFLHFHRNV